MNKKTLFLSAVVTFALLLSGCKFGEAASTNVSAPSSKTETSSSSSNGSSPFNSSPTASSTPTTSVVSSSSSTPVSSSSSAPSSSSIPTSSPSAKDTPSFGDAFKQNGATLTLRGIITLVKANGFYMADDTGFAYVDREQKNEIQLRHKNLAPSSSEIVQGAYVEVTGQISTEKRSLVIVPANDANVQILSNEKPSFTLPAAKEASGNLEQVDEIIKNKPSSFDVISGDDALTFPMISCGAVGVISVIGNALPKEFSKMIRLQMRGEYDAARKIHHRFTDLFGLLFVDGNPAGVKAMLHEMGMIENVLRLPLVPTRISTVQRMTELMKDLKI